MLKSPSAKELGRRVPPIAASTVFRKPDDPKGRGVAGFGAGSKIGVSQRTQLKVNRQNLATARPLTSNNNNLSALPVKRTKFTPSSA